MRYSTQIKPFSMLGDSAVGIADALERCADPLILTEGGEAKAVVMGVREYEQMQETLALLQIIDLAEREIAEGKVRPAREVLEEIRTDLHARYAAE